MRDIDWDRYIPVEGQPHLYKDRQSGALINMDFDAFDNARKKQAVRLREKKRLDNLESEISDIKSLLQQILEKQT